MSELLIKDIELSSETSGIEIFMYNDGRTICRYLGEDRWFEVEVIPVPEHGRVVDADKLKYDAETCRETTDAFIELIDKAPTILEATKC